MKTNFKSIIAALAAAMILVTSCDFSDFGDINKSPNSPSDPNTAMLFTYSSFFVKNFIMTSSTYDPWPAEWTGYIAETKNNQFGPLNTTVDFNTGTYYLYVLRQMNTIISLNSDPETASESYVTEFGDNSNQIAVATTLKAFFMMTLTDIVGPLPYSEAFKGESDDNWKPKFDSQQDIYTALNTELEEAYSKFNESGSLNGTYDIFYGGDIAKWKKFNATLRMMMAIKLADVDPSNGKTRFAKAYSQGGMTDVEDGFNYTFSDGNYYVGSTSTDHYAWFYYIGNAGYSGRGLGYGPNTVIVEKLKEYKDPRMFTYFTLDGYLGTVNADPTDFDSYKGIQFGLESNDAVNSAKVDMCSVASKYCEPTATYGVITTARCLLVEAEAATLGWISASASSLYEAGIKASFEFEGASGVDDYIAAHPLPSSKSEALTEIVTQRFLAGFLTDGIEAWSDWRRYNIPYNPLTDFQKDECGGKTYPYRMQYYDTDITTNQESYETAVKTYFNGNDDRWERVWWDVADNGE